MQETTGLRLAFHIESAGDFPEALKHDFEHINGVAGVETRLLQPARGIDPQSVATVLVLITATTKTGVTVTSHIEEIIRNVKKIAQESGLGKVCVEHRRQEQDIDLLTPSELDHLAEETTLRNLPPGR